MPSAVAATVTFLKTVGLAVGGLTISGGTALAIGAATVVAGAIAAQKLISSLYSVPSLDSDSSRQATVRGTVEPQKLIYGEALVSGPISFVGVAGTDNRDLYHSIVLAGHPSDSISDIYFDDERIQSAHINGSGNVTTGVFGPKDGTTICVIRKLTGSQTTADSVLDGAFNTINSSEHIGTNLTYIVTKFTLTEDSQETWDKFLPNDIKALVKGKKVYDPRQDNTSTHYDASVGVSTQRSTNSATWAWSDNPVWCLVDYLTDDRFGMDIDLDRIDLSKAVDAADICDVAVSVPGGGESRYTCNGVVFGTATHKANINKILSSMNGMLTYTNGKYVIRAGAFESVGTGMTLTEDHMTGPVRLKTSFERNERFNTITGTFVDPEKNFKEIEFPKVQITSALTRDNSEELTRELKLSMTNSRYMAQRIAHKLIQLSDLQKVLTFPTNLAGVNISVGDRVNVTLSEFGYTNKTFVCLGWTLSESGSGGVNLTLREDDSSSYSDLAVSGYSTVTPAGGIEQGFFGVPDPNGLSATAHVESIELDWTNPANMTGIIAIEVFASPNSSWSSAVKIGETIGTQFVHDESNGVDAIVENDQRYYWVRARRFPAGEGSDAVSDRNPDSDTSTVQATKGALGALADQDTVGDGQIDDNAVGNDQIADDAVDTDQIADEAVDTEQIADDAVDITKISNTLETTNFSTTNGTGWQIKTDGTATFNDVNVRGEVVATQLNVQDATISGSLKANELSDGIVKITSVSQEVWNEIESRVGSTTGSTGFFESASGNLTGGDLTLTTASTKAHATGQTVYFELDAVYFWSSVTSVSGNDLLLDVKFQHSTDNVTYTTVNTTQITVERHNYFNGFMYDIDNSVQYQLTGLAAGNYYFRVSLEPVGAAPNAFSIAYLGVPVSFEVNEIGTGSVSTSGNADTLDNLDSTAFLRSNTNDTFDGDLTITGQLILNGSIDQYNVTDLDVTDKTITVNSGNTQTLSDGAGLIVDRGTAADASILWDETDDQFDFSHSIAFDGTPTTTNQARGIFWTGYDKEGTTDYSDAASIRHTTNTGGHSGSVLLISSQNDSGDGISFVTHASSKLKHNNNNIATENFVTGQGYLTSFTETDPTVPSHVKLITTTKISNWDAAYTYSQVGHLPLTGGTVSGTLTLGSGLQYSGVFANPTTSTASFYNQSGVGPTASGLKFQVRVGSTPATALTIDDVATLDKKLIITGRETDSGGSNAYVSSDTKLEAVTDNVSLELHSGSDDSPVSIYFKSGVNAPSDFAYISYFPDYDGTSENAALVIGSENDGLSSSDYIRLQSRVVVDNNMLTSDSSTIMEWYTGGTQRAYLDTSGNLQLDGTVTWSGGSSVNANTAYTYSQVGHLPLAGGTVSGAVTISGNATFGGRLEATDGTAIKAAYGFSNSAGTGLSYTSTNNRLNFMSGGAVVAYVQTGSSNPQVETMYVNGELDVNGSVSWSGGSSTLSNTAYSWGNHASAGYLETNDNITVGTISSGAITSTGNSTFANLKVTETGKTQYIHFYLENGTANIADDFTDTTTQKSYIWLNGGVGSNDPGFIMHETADSNTADQNKGVLHLVPSDDNSSGDYVSIHGTNDADCLRLDTAGRITTASNYRLELSSGSSSVYINDSLEVEGGVDFDTLAQNGTTRIDGSGNATFGTVSATGLSTFSNSIEQVLQIKGTGNTGTIHFFEGTTRRGILGYTNGSAIQPAADDNDMVLRSEQSLLISTDETSHYWKFGDDGVLESGPTLIDTDTRYFSEKLLVNGRTRVAGQFDIAAGAGYSNYGYMSHDDDDLLIATARVSGSGDITISPYGQVNITQPLSSTANVTTTGVLQVNVGTASHQRFRITRPNSTTAALYMGVDSSNNAMMAANNSALRIGKDLSGTFYEYLTVESGGNTNVKNALEINGTTRIAQNGNATLGTISSGAITSSGGISANTTNSGSNYFHANSSDGRVLRLRDRSANGGNIVQFENGAGSIIWELVGRDGMFYIYKNSGTGSGYKWQIDSSGNHTITGNATLTAQTTFNGLIRGSRASTSADVDYFRMEMPSWSGHTSYLKSLTWHDGGSNIAAIGAEFDGSKTNIHFHSQYNAAYKGTGDKTFTVYGNGNVNVLNNFGINGTLRIAQNGDATLAKITASGSGTSTSPVLGITSSNSLTFIHASNSFAANMTAGQFHGHFFGKAGSSKDAGGIGYYWSSAGSNDNFVSIGHWANDHLLRLYGNGSLNIHSGALQLGGTTRIALNGDATLGAITSNGYNVLTSGNQIITAGSITAGDASTSLGYYVGTTQVIQGSTKNIVNVGSITAGGNITTSGGLQLGSNLTFTNSGTTKRGIQGTVGSNDFWFFGGGATASNAGFVEIAAGDDGATAGSYEPIYVRQYLGTPLTGTVQRTLTLLDNNGDTDIPNDLDVGGTISSGAITSSGNVVSTGTHNGSQFRASLGTQSAPAYTFKTDDDTGFYGGGNTVYGVTGGQKRLTLNASGVSAHNDLIVLTGNLKFGTQTVIDSSRNHFGEQATFSGKVVMGGDGAIAQIANAVAADTTNTYTLAVGSQSGNKSILAARDINTSAGNYQVNGTTVIDSSRNGKFASILAGEASLPSGAGNAMYSSSQYGLYLQSNVRNDNQSYFDTLFVRNNYYATSAVAGQKAQIGFATQDGDGDHHRAVIVGTRDTLGGTAGGQLQFLTRTQGSVPIVALTLRHNKDAVFNGGLVKGMSHLELLNNGGSDATATSPRLYSPASATLGISMGGAERLRINSTELSVSLPTPVIAGIDTNLTTRRWSIGGENGHCIIKVDPNTAQADSYFAVEVDNTERLALDNNGLSLVSIVQQTSATDCGIVHPRENLDGVPLEDGLAYFAFNHNLAAHPTSESTFDTMERDNITTFKQSGTFTNASAFTLSADSYLTEFHGYLLITTAGNYRFGVNADDAVEMYIDGVRVADDYGGHGATGFFNDESRTELYLEIGYHKVFARFEEVGGGDSIQLGWNGGSGTTLSAIPTGKFFHCAADRLKSYNGTIHGVGNLTMTANVTAYSDEKLKSDIQTLDGSKVYEMRGVSFTKDDQAGSGVIAQELEKVAPELVHDGEYKSVAYGNLVGYLIEAVKDQKEIIDNLTQRIEELENGNH
tara:strand:+ start:6137 stop:15487 length:9351 start_codon:yes stop_codon:yes gene_type:complete